MQLLFFTFFSLSYFKSILSFLQDSTERTTSLRQLLADSKTEISDLKKQVEELVDENNKLKGQGLTNGHAPSASNTGGESASHIHSKLMEVTLDLLLKLYTTL